MLVFLEVHASFLEVRASFFMQNYTNNIPECRNDTLLQKFSQEQNQSKKNITYHGHETEKEDNM